MPTVIFDDCRCDVDTDAAILVKGVGENPIWIPKSQVHDDSDVYKRGTEGELVISEWWAVEKGLI